MVACAERGGNSDGVFLWRNGAPLTRAQFLGEAAGSRRQFPPGEYLLNLCEQRETFLLAFAASILARRTQLMPAARGEAALAELAAAHPDNLRVTDEDIRRWRAAPARPASPPPDLVPRPRGSGAGGIHLRQHRTRAAPLQALACAGPTHDSIPPPCAARSVCPEHVPVSIVGTVPPHHIYGIEFTVLLPLFANMTVHAERPLFPADVAAALSQPPARGCW